MCHENCDTHFATGLANKEIDFDVDFDDGKVRKTKAEQNIAKKDSIQI